MEITCYSHPSLYFIKRVVLPDIIYTILCLWYLQFPIWMLGKWLNWFFVCWILFYRNHFLPKMMYFCLQALAIYRGLSQYLCRLLMSRGDIHFWSAQGVVPNEQSGWKASAEYIKPSCVWLIMCQNSETVQMLHYRPASVWPSLTMLITDKMGKVWTFGFVVNCTVVT